MDTQPITKEQVVQRLASARERIHALGARRIALFGSVVRGEARPDSDVDLLVQFDPAKKTFRNFGSFVSSSKSSWAAASSWSRPSRSAPTSVLTSCARRRMSFSPREYLQHIRRSSGG